MSTNTIPDVGIISLTGATCTSCIIGIQHFARRLSGVEDITVDRATGKIKVEYTGDEAVLDKICEYVERIGYHAERESPV